MTPTGIYGGTFIPAQKDGPREDDSISFLSVDANGEKLLNQVKAFLKNSKFDCNNRAISASHYSQRTDLAT